MEVWNNIFASRTWGKYPPEAILRFFGRNFLNKGLAKGVRVLELGCGPGANIWYFSREGFEAYGIDFSPIAIEQAVQRLKTENLKADLKVGDISSLPYEDNYFDVIVDNACVYCNDEKKTMQIFSEVYRVLKPQGWFLSITFADDTSRGEGFQKINELEFVDAKTGTFTNAGHVRLTSRQKIDQLYGKHFQINQAEKLKLIQENGHTISHWVITARKA